VPLGSFVMNQRSEYRRYMKNKKSGEGGNNDGKGGSGGNSNSSMMEERMKELEGMGFMWSARDGMTPWNVRLEELREYEKRMYGNCDILNSWTKNRPLSHWVSKQRHQYKLCNQAERSNLMNSDLIGDILSW